MTRSLLIAAAVLSTLAGATSTARADDGAGYTLARFRRCVPHYHHTYVYPRPNINQYQRNEFNYQKNEFNSLNVYPHSSPLPKAQASFSRTPAPHVHVPPACRFVTAGKGYQICANYLGETPGNVTIYVGGTSHPCEVLSWTESAVQFVLPNMGVIRPGTYAELQINRRFDGAEVWRETVQLVNPPDLKELDLEELPPGGEQGVPVGIHPMGPMLHAAGG